MEDNNRSALEDVSPAQAVLVGALAPGVNAPTWNTLKMVFLMLGVSLICMLALAFTSSDLGLVLHVGLLVGITLTLFVLLSRFLEETGLVSVEQQMKELGLTPQDTKQDTKTE